MYCQRCGQKVEDEARFCTNCGEHVNLAYGDNATRKTLSAESSETYLEKKYVAPDNQFQIKGTAYAGTSFKFSMFGLLFVFCCGLELLAGIPAIVFGIAAIRNHEPEKLKSYTGLVLGILEVLCFIFLMIAGADSQ